ncbi:MAG: helix-turn-helix domain-containing protein, partial [Verrucomicrobiia bacterium]
MAKRGWNQTEAAKALSVSQANISRWLSQNHEPSADVLIRIAKAFGVTLDELLRAPGPALRIPRAEFDTVVWPPRWFRQLRLTWQRSPKERHHIETALDLAWPNQKPDIIAWLNKK